jgi:exosome complex component CSL4
MSQIIPIAVPGQLLGATDEYLPGPGTHILDSNLYASILGPITTTVPPKPAGLQKRLTKITPAAPAALPTVSIEQNISSAKDGASKGKTEILPEVNSTVLCRVTRITPRQASVAILVVGETVLEGEWQGLIRVQDVRATEKDKVKIFESFRPGDIVRAVVVSVPAPVSHPKFDIFSQQKLIMVARFPLEINRITTCRRRAITWGLSWLSVKLGMLCILSAGRNTRTLRRAPARAGRLRNHSRMTRQPCLHSARSWRWEYTI